MVYVAENTTAVLTVAASDADADTVTLSATGGADRDRFAFNASTGALTFVDAPDYEVSSDVDGNNVYLVQVTADDGSRTTVQDISVMVTNTNDNDPVLVGAATVNVDENTVAVQTLTADDVDGDDLTFTIDNSSVDAARFFNQFDYRGLAFRVAPEL